MEFVINSNTIISLATLIAALASIGGVVRWGIKYIEHDKEQDKDLKSIKTELTLLCYGQTACLRGLQEQGCDGPVKDALEKLEKHLNEAAHDAERS